MIVARDIHHAEDYLAGSLSSSELREGKDLEDIIGGLFHIGPYHNKKKGGLAN